MARMAIRAILASITALASVTVSGCGTVLNICDCGPQTDPAGRVYGGVRIDTKYSPDYLQVAVEGAPGRLEDNALHLALGMGLLPDIPLSAFGDPLTLPWVLYMQATGGWPLPGRLYRGPMTQGD